MRRPRPSLFAVRRMEISDRKLFGHLATKGSNMLERDVIRIQFHSFRKELSRLDWASEEYDLLSKAGSSLSGFVDRVMEASSPKDAEKDMAEKRVLLAQSRDCLVSDLERGDNGRKERARICAGYEKDILEIAKPIESEGFVKNLAFELVFPVQMIISDGQVTSITQMLLWAQKDIGDVFWSVEKQNLAICKNVRQCIDLSDALIPADNAALRTEWKELSEQVRKIHEPELPVFPQRQKKDKGYQALSDAHLIMK